MEAADFVKLTSDIAAQIAAIDGLSSQGIETTLYDNQYFYPMGTQALVHVGYSVPETLYVGELRSGKTVHGSLRPIAQKLMEVLSYDIPGIALYGDRDEDSWTSKRGHQTIAEKAS